MSRFKVLKFPTENSDEVDISIVASCWIINESTCWWPHNNNEATSLAKKCTKPTEKSFLKTPYMEVLFETDDFKEARAVEKKKVDESTTDGEATPRNKRKRSRNPKYDSTIYEKSDTGRRTKDTTRKDSVSGEESDSSSDDDGVGELSNADDSETSFNPIRTTFADQSTPKSTKSGNTTKEVDYANKSDAMASPVPSTTDSTSAKKNFADMLKIVLTIVKSMQLDIKYLSRALKEQDEKMDRLIAIVMKENPTVNPFVGRKYKLQTDEELEELEKSLQNKEDLELLSQRLVLLGDKTEKDLIRNSLKFLLHKDLASKYTAQGRGEKKKFVSLQIFKAIAGAVRSVVPAATDKTIQSLVGINLTQSVDWDQGRQNRSGNKTANKTADSSADKDDMEVDTININPQPQSKKRKD